MPDKYLVEFLAKWVRDEELRCKVLHQEKTSLIDWGLDGPQRDDLLSLDKPTILARIVQELEDDFGLDLDRLKEEVFGPGGGGGGTGGGAAAIYGQGQAHVRRTDPKQIAKGIERTVIVLGQGFDTGVKIRFAKAGSQTVEKTATEIGCDADVYQRAAVKVKLDALGGWSVRAQNAGESESTEDVTLTVV